MAVFCCFYVYSHSKQEVLKFPDTVPENFAQLRAHPHYPLRSDFFPLSSSNLIKGVKKKKKSASLMPVAAATGDSNT